MKPFGNFDEKKKPFKIKIIHEALKAHINATLALSIIEKSTTGSVIWQTYQQIHWPIYTPG